MNKISECIQKYHLIIEKVEKNPTYILLYGKEKIYLFKEKENSKKELFQFLETIQYPYYVPLLNDYDDPYELYPYYEDTIKEDSMKGKELINALLSLHLKTMSEEDLEDNTKEDIYERIKKELTEKEAYYEELQKYSESFPFPRVDYYYLLNNISIIYKSIWWSKELLEKWFQLKSHSIYKSYVLHNAYLKNFKISHISYFINFEECYRDYRIYDLLNFYKEDQLKISMPPLIKAYNNQSPLTKSELLLLNCLLLIPNTIHFTEDVYNNTVQIKYELDKIDKTFQFLSEKDKEEEQKNEEKLKQ